MRKNDFNKAREWFLAQRVSAVALLIFVTIDIVLSVTGNHRSMPSLGNAVCGIAVSVCAINCVRHLRCPHCGKSVMSFWLGRDGAGRNCMQLITQHKPIICAHCGEEVETD